MEQWSTSDIHYINKYQLLTAKPVFYVVNLTKKDFARKKNKWLSKIHEWIQSHGRGLHSSTFRLNVSIFSGIRWVHEFPPVY